MANVYWCCRRSWTSQSLTRLVDTLSQNHTHHAQPVIHKITGSQIRQPDTRVNTDVISDLYRAHGLTSTLITPWHHHRLLIHSHSHRVKLTAGGVSAAVWRIPDICSDLETEQQIRERGGWQDERQRQREREWGSETRLMGRKWRERWTDDLHASWIVLAQS